MNKILFIGATVGFIWGLYMYSMFKILNPIVGIVVGLIFAYAFAIARKKNEK